MGGSCRPAYTSTSSRRPGSCSSSESSSAESDHGPRHRRHRHRRSLGPPHLRLPLGRPRRAPRLARLRRGIAAPPRGVRPSLAPDQPRRAVALPPRPLGRAADARIRTQIHDRPAAHRAARDPRATGRGATAPRPRRGVRRLAPRPRLPDRDPRCAGRGAFPPRRRRESRDFSGAAHHRERGTLARGPGGPVGVHRRHGTERRAGPLGLGVRPAARRVLAPRIVGNGHPPHARARRRFGAGSQGETPSLDALLSSGRDFGPGEARGDALQGPRDGRAGRRPVHHRREVVVLIVMRHGATADEVQKVISVVEEMGYQAAPMPGAQRTAVGLVGNDGRVDASRLEGLPGVKEVIHVSKPYKQVSREWRPEPTVVKLAGGVTVGGNEVVAMAGPCSLETERQVLESARLVKEAGAVILRGGAWKPRSSPYSFQGLGRPGLKLLAKAREETGLLICTEAMDPDGVGWVSEMADIVQIGARNMQNFSLLKVAGRCGKPVLLKRGISATIVELLLSAEYLLAEGNHDVILCERGVRSFDTMTRNLFDLTAIPVVHKLSHLPIIADPSHGTGLRDKVIPMARAAIAAGADGIMVEVHPHPEEALSDGAQSLFPDQFAQLMREVRIIAEAIGRRVAEPAAVGA